MEVYIVLGGKRVPHHAIEYDATKEVSCWIESKVDTPFKLVYKSTKAKHAMRVTTLADGSEVVINITLPEDANSEHSVLDPFVSTILIDDIDDDACLETATKSPYFGEIRMVVHKVEVKPSSNAPSLYSIPEPSKVHEKSKKGLTHHVKYGEKQLVRVPKKYTSTRLGTLVAFVFKYRPLEMLQAHGIVMCNPDVSTSSQASDEPGSKKRKEMDDHEESDKEDSADEEEKALLAQLEKVRQKKLAKDAEASARKKIKLEPKAHFLPGEIIDLTDDSTPTGKSLLLPKVPKTPTPVVDLT